MGDAVVKDVEHLLFAANDVSVTSPASWRTMHMAHMLLLYPGAFALTQCRVVIMAACHFSRLVPMLRGHYDHTTLTRSDCSPWTFGSLKDTFHV